jgi:hypothetical protein
MAATPHFDLTVNRALLAQSNAVVGFRQGT